MIYIDIPVDVRDVLDTLNQNGFEAYIVGGCVRDSILYRAPKDWDICTNATPQQILEVFKNDKVIETGIKHGTVTIIKSTRQIEVTTYRIESEYSDGRHPDKVNFTSNLKQDLSRRDFTINAMAYSEKTGLVDPFGGEVDLQNKLIRCVRNPVERICEDYLRILRACRFALKYRFDIDPELLVIMQLNAHLLNRISRERIRDELLQILYNLTSKDFQQYRFLFVSILPQLEKVNINKISYMLSTYISSDIEALSCLIWDIDRKQDVKDLLNSLRLDSKTMNSIVQIWEHRFDNVSYMEDYSLKLLLNKIGEQNTKTLFSMKSKERFAEEVMSNDKYNKMLNIVSNDECYSLKQLAINGDDIQNLGVYEGTLVGYMLQDCLFHVMKNPQDNIKDKLFEYLNEHYKNEIAIHKMI